LLRQGQDPAFEPRAIPTMRLGTANSAIFL
jgi:hypothetical protein